MDILPTALLPLEKFKQFIVYKVIPNLEHAGKMEKIPVDALGGYKIDPHDENSWLFFQDAAIAAKSLGVDHGVGFSLTENDPFFLLDIDNCLKNDGNWSDLAIELCTKLAGAAVEVSTSQRGLHIIGQTQPVTHGCRNKVLGLELYTQKRFIALTGINAIGSAEKECTAMLTEIVEKYFSKNNKNNFDAWTDTPCEQWNGPIDDQELIMRALRTVSVRSMFGGGASFRDLWENNAEVLEQVYHGDKSAYDFALAMHLAYWTGNNCERMFHLMHQSKLYRSKWEREKYVQDTILNACAKQNKFVCDRAIEKPENLNQAQQENIKPILVNGTTYLSAAQQLDLFQNCIYIRDEHKILIPGGDIVKPDQFKAIFGGFTFQMDNANERLSRNAWEAFSESQAFRKPQVDSTCFYPDLPPAAIVKKEGRTLVNTYFPVETPRRSGDITPFINHLKKIIADERDREILICYMAACVQHKGVKFKWAPLIQGVDGNGKTVLSQCVAFAISYRYSHFPDVTELTEKYNGWMYKKLFIGIEDAYIPDTAPQFMEKLKTWITGEYIEIRAMHSEKVMREICCNYILNSNHKDAIKKNRNDRRYAPFYTVQQRKEDLARDGLTQEYFMDFYHWLKMEAGFEIVNDFLHTYSIKPEYNPAHKGIAPITSSTSEALYYSMDNVEQEISEAIEAGLYGFKNGWVSSLALDRLLERIRSAKKLPHNQRREMLFTLGYNWHPHLPEGRSNIIIPAEGGRPKLFIKSGHKDLYLTNAAEIVKAYTAAQQE